MLRAWRRRSAEYNKVHLIRPEQANVVNILSEFLKLKNFNWRNYMARYMALGFFLHEFRPKKPYAKTKVENSTAIYFSNKILTVKVLFASLLSFYCILISVAVVAVEL